MQSLDTTNPEITFHSLTSVAATVMSGTAERQEGDPFGKFLVVGVSLNAAPDYGETLNHSCIGKVYFL